MNILKQTTILTISFLVFFCATLFTYGQEKELSGKVISASTKEVLPYVNISIPGKGISSVSNEEGMFVFKFPGDDNSRDSIIFSCVGYNTKAISISDALKQMDIIVDLTESVVELKEVVVKPITIRELLDSIGKRNYTAFNSPMKLNGYYREFVFTNAKCTEYSDALFEYYFDNSLKSNGQLKIAASRCEKAVRKNDKNQNYEAMIDSRVKPDKMFGFALLADMLKRYFPDKELDEYQYGIEGNNINKDLLVTVFPKSGTDRVYKLQFILSDDFMLRSYKLQVPADLLKNVKERSALGIHGKVEAFAIEARYGTNNNGIYPVYFKVMLDVKVYGKFLGTVINQVTAQKSEFIVTQINTKNINPIPKNEIYKKGNVCDNGIAINAALLKNYNFILPTKKDSLAIISITKDISADK